MPVSYTHLDVYKRQPSGWICDGEPDCGASDKQIIDNSDEDPHRCKLCVVVIRIHTLAELKEAKTLFLYYSDY